MSGIGGKILLLTSDVNMGVVAARYLNRQGFIVTSVLDQDKALERYAADRPDLVLMDDMGSSLRNIRFLRRLRQLQGEPGQVPILIGSTPGSDTNFETEARQLGVTDTIHQPFRDLPKLADIVRAHLEQRSSAPPEAPLRDSGRYGTTPSQPGLAQPQTAVGVPERDPRRGSGRYSSVPPGQGLAQPSTSVGVPARDPQRRSQADAPGESKFKDTLRYGVESHEARRASQPPPPQRSSQPPERLELKPRPLPDVGSLSDFSVPLLLHRCAVERFSGMLMLRKSPQEKGVYIQNGSPVFVESDIPEERLGTFLRRIGRLNQETFDEVEKEIEGTAARLGDVLVAKGLIDPNDLFRLLTEHLTEKLIATFAWHDGVFAVEPGNSPSRPVAPLRLKTPRIILDGIGRHYGEGLLENILRIPDHTYTYIREDTPIAVEQLELNTREARLLDLARQGDMLGGIIRFASGRRVEVLRLLYALYTMEVIGFTLEPTVRRSSAPPPSEQQLAEGLGLGSDGVGTAWDEDKAPPPPDSGILLFEELQELDDADLFEIHGIDRDATTEQIHKAFRQRAKELHPDKLRKYSADVQKRGAEVYRRLVQGYRVLADPRQRAQYIQDLQDPAKLRQRMEEELRAHNEAELEASRQISLEPEEVAEIKKVENKEPQTPDAALLEEARAALRAEKLEEGLSKMKDLVELAPDVPRYEAWLGWAIYLVNPDRRKVAEKHIAAARKAAPTISDPFVLMARISEREGANDQAADCYAKAMELEPSNLDLARESRLFDIRVRKGKTKRRPETKTEARARTKKETANTGLNKDVGAILKGLFSKKK